MMRATPMMRLSRERRFLPMNISTGKMMKVCKCFCSTFCNPCNKTSLGNPHVLEPLLLNVEGIRRAETVMF